MDSLEDTELLLEQTRENRLKEQSQCCQQTQSAHQNLCMRHLEEERLQLCQQSRPKCVFADDNELMECLLWWQDKLGLNDWIIKARLVSLNEMEDQDHCGENALLFQSKEALIKILKREDWDDDCIVIYCAEQILVHELLHCMYEWLEPNGTYEGTYTDAIEHQKIEQMARTMIMVKYNLPLEYFRSF